MRLIDEAMHPQKLFFKKEGSSVYRKNPMMPEMFWHHKYFTISTAFLKFLVIRFVI